MFRSFIAKTRPSRGSLLRSGDRSFRVAVAAESSGKQTISLAEFDRKLIRNLMFGGFVLVGGMCYHVQEYVLMNNAKQEYVKVVSHAIKQIEQQQAIKQIEQQQAIKEQAKASAGPEELK